LGAVKPGMAMLPVMARDRGSAFSSVAHCCSLRPSFQRMAGRSGLSAAVEQRRAVHLAGKAHRLDGLAGAAGSAFTAALVALHQSAGFCSDQPAGAGNVERRGGLLDHRVLVVDDDGFDTGRADIDA
jgi:hypothetical protein